MRRLSRGLSMAFIGCRSQFLLSVSMFILKCKVTGLARRQVYGLPQYLPFPLVVFYLLFLAVDLR